MIIYTYFNKLIRTTFDKDFRKKNSEKFFPKPLDRKKCRSVSTGETVDLFASLALFSAPHDLTLFACVYSSVLSSSGRVLHTLRVYGHRRADPTSRPANVIGEESTAVAVALDSPAVLQCYAIGWPQPIVTWWRADRMLPMTSDLFEQRKDHSLIVRLVTVNVLGPYTCQAYNGLGRAASWTVTLQAYGTPVAGRDRPDSPYLVPAKHVGPPAVYRTAPPPPPPRTDDVPPQTTTQPSPQRVFTGKPSIRNPALTPGESQRC